MSTLLKYAPITHANIKPFLHPRMGVEVNGQAAVRYFRFGRRVRVERLELPHSSYGRWVPSVPTHPAHLSISILDESSYRWQVLHEVDLPPDPRISGEGLSQEMSIEDMEAHFEKILQEPPYVIDLGGVCTDHLRVECDREHPVWPNHGECNGGPFNVPFGILNPLKAYGEMLEGPAVESVYKPPLQRDACEPAAPSGMQVYEKMGRLFFEGRHLSVGFSLRRPLLVHLGWDVLGQELARHNRLAASLGFFASQTDLVDLSGPLLRTLTLDCGAQAWTGEVIVRGNRVIYQNLTCGVPGLILDATFTVEPQRLVVELTQACDTTLPVIEGEAWRLCWNAASAMTGAAAVPTLAPGRNGDVHLPMLWAGDGNGCLSCRPLEGVAEERRLQVESYRPVNCVTGGFVLGPRPGPDACRVIPPGVQRASFELAVTNLELRRKLDTAEPGLGVQRHWASIFSCYRPELGGFSNNAVSVNCHVNQQGPLEIVVNTHRHSSGPNPLDLLRFTIERALLDGGGYGYWRNLYLDADPILVSAAGRIYQADPDIGWLRRIEPGLLEAFDRMTDTIGPEGLAISRSLSGNSGSYRWSSNAMDVVGFGYKDAYVNAWTYRAFRNAAALISALGKPDRAERCREVSGRLRAAYTPQLVNPATGWVAGWRSRDGQLHDYAFLWINGVALAFGLLEESTARKALLGLERLREQVGPESASEGLPLNLLPIRPEDHMLPRIFGYVQPTFEHYTDGSLSAYPATYYLRALSIYGFKDQALKLAVELEEGYRQNVFSGGNTSGVEFKTWAGIPTGYEGTFVGSFPPLYGIAIERGLIAPAEPEWWPKDG